MSWKRDSEDWPYNEHSLNFFPFPCLGLIFRYFIFNKQLLNTSFVRKIVLGRNKSEEKKKTFSMPSRGIRSFLEIGKSVTTPQYDYHLAMGQWGNVGIGKKQ
jgi:hypothetical protein